MYAALTHKIKLQVRIQAGPSPGPQRREPCWAGPGTSGRSLPRHWRQAALGGDGGGFLGPVWPEGSVLSAPRTARTALHVALGGSVFEPWALATLFLKVLAASALRSGPLSVRGAWPPRSGPALLFRSGSTAGAGHGTQPLDFHLRAPQLFVHGVFSRERNGGASSCHQPPTHRLGRKHSPFTF